MSSCSVSRTIAALANARSMLGPINTALTQPLLVAQVVALSAGQAEKLSALGRGMIGARVDDAGVKRGGLSRVRSG